jgi:hypothetical protein
MEGKPSFDLVVHKNRKEQERDGGAGEIRGWP